MIEIFIPVKGYEGMYEVDELGNVKSLERFDSAGNFKRSRILKQETNNAGYKRVTLCKEGKTKRFFVHRLIYSTFNGEIPKGYEIHHKDFDKTNNKLENLDLVTKWENSYYSKENRNNKIDIKQVLEIRNSDLSNKDLSKIYGVSPRQILRIKKFERWNIETSQYRAKPIWEGVETR